MKEQASSDFIKYLLVIVIGIVISYCFYLLFKYHEGRITQLEAQVSSMQQELMILKGK